jgi:hypothetical protein
LRFIELVNSVPPISPAAISAMQASGAPEGPPGLLRVRFDIYDLNPVHAENRSRPCRLPLQGAPIRARTQ